MRLTVDGGVLMAKNLDTKFTFLDLLMFRNAWLVNFIYK